MPIGEIARVVTDTSRRRRTSRPGRRSTSGSCTVVAARNVVAGSAEARLDVRVATPEELERVSGLLDSLTPVNPRVELTVTGGWNRPVMMRTPAIAQMYELARAVAACMDVELAEASVGGASDGNFAAALGLPVLDGFGAVGAGAHAAHEHVSIAGMLERTALAAAVVAAFAATDS